MERRNKLIVGIFFITFFAGCQSPDKVFEVREADETGLHFSNVLKPDDKVNMLSYMYFYNGAGVGCGDFNNDGLIDVFFSSNQQQNKLFLNQGNLRFEDVTSPAQIPSDGGWSTGVSVVDINNDGLLDMYVCRVGKFQNLQSANQLLVCQEIKNNIPVYKDEAEKYGLHFSGFSTQATFLDFDLDGDLDMFLLNHSLRYNNTFAPRHTYIGTFDSLSGDRFFRNDGERFADITQQAGINSSVIGYGLGVAVSDINLDGYPDIYIGNDFHENDYLYINQRDGTFKDELENMMMHTSQFSMGVDIADINNDGYSDVISVDMLPSDPYILRRSLGEDAYDVFQHKLRHGYNHQYARNTLQLNRRNGMFSEIGLYAGVYATDWSWAPLFFDFDHDGLKDLFVTNGIPKRLNDIDYVNYVSNESIQGKIRGGQLNKKEMEAIEQFPQIKLKNKFFRNLGSARFTDLADGISNDRSTFSNGAAYADFDNDGDLDIVVNNIDDEALLYENLTNASKPASSVQLKLMGSPENIRAVGATVLLLDGGEVRRFEKYPTRGFQSSMEVPVHVSLDKKFDSAIVVWPDRTFQVIRFSGESFQTISYTSGLPRFDSSVITNLSNPSSIGVEELPAEVISHNHSENPFVEFDRETLIPYMVSREGPALAVGDVDQDGLEDVFIGSAKREKSAIYRQLSSGKFVAMPQPDIEKDSVFEDVDAIWVDVNNDQLEDLVVASGGNEYFGSDEHMRPRVYINDTKGRLVKKADAFPAIFLTASCIASADFTGDGYMDLFIGARAVPWEYGQIPESYLLANDGSGRFINVSTPELSSIGIVTHALWCDLDKDGDSDLVVSLEWGAITAFINDKGKLRPKALTSRQGWWNFTLPCDVDNDGDIDLLAGNLGWNSRLHASADRPVRMYVNDFDGNGKNEQVLSYYVDDQELPFSNKSELEKQLPVMKKKFLYAENFAKADMEDLFDRRKLQEARVLKADFFSSVVLINNNMSFSIQELPWQAQLSPMKCAAVVNANNDGLPDFFIAGNFYENNSQMGRYDADFGTVLLNRGGGIFDAESLNGAMVKGQVRRIRKISLKNYGEAFLLARNNDPIKIIQFKPFP